MKILGVDDKVENLYLLESMLRGSGYDVVLANNGVEAMQKLREGSFDLIIADILMPQMDGFELCYEVKHHPTFRNIPFIFYTATYTEKKDEALALSLGASRFIVKPVEPERFLAIVKEVIEEVETGRLVSMPPVEREKVLLKSYNRRLVRKLNQKVEQLEESTRKLNTVLLEKDREISERSRVEAEVRALNKQLEERVRRRTSDLQAANKELETFTSAVSHDLRAPLRGITGWSEALAEDYADRLDEQAKTYVALVRSEAGRMGRLIEGLLQLCQSTRRKLRREKVNLSQVAVAVEKELRRENPDRMVDFIIAPEIVVEGDPVLLPAVMRNLLENAWKFTAQRPQARIEFGTTLQEGKTVYFVRDNGAGFDMARASKLFEPFERLHRSTEFPGTGIGLATVQQIVRRHDGHIWAEAVVGEGASFYFTLK